MIPSSITPGKWLRLPRFFYLLVFLAGMFNLSCARQDTVYVCPPCNLSCDDLHFDRPGTCPHCQMSLLPEEELQAVAIQTGSGFFQIEGYRGHPLAVFYHKPTSFAPDSEILFVLPGSGRSAAAYRDAWVEAAERHGLLIVALMYPERFYAFEDYHLCGLVDSSNLMEQVTTSTDAHIAHLEETGLVFTLNERAADRIFADFDRIFVQVREAVQSTQTNYHLFGHSAGGHIAHRLALFGESPYLDHILAANASFYTLPTWEVPFPFGLQDMPVDDALLKRAFSKRFTLLLGEQDNAQETRGIFLYSPTANQQGMHRLARGKYFFATAREAAQELEVPFNWELMIVPGVGHDHARMGEAAMGRLQQSWE